MCVMAMFMLFTISKTTPEQLVTHVGTGRTRNFHKTAFVAFFRYKECFTTSRGHLEILEALTAGGYHVGHPKNESGYNTSRLTEKLHRLIFYAASYPQFKVLPSGLGGDMQMSVWLVPGQLVEGENRKAGIYKMISTYDFGLRLPFLRQLLEGLSNLRLSIRTTPYEIEHLGSWENEILTYYLANLLYPFAHLFLVRHFPESAADLDPVPFHLHMAQSLIYLCSCFQI
jgi:hypothetical protein